MNWEPWTGCYPISEGCKNCYFYGPYAKRYGQNTIEKTDKFDWPIRKNAKGEYNINWFKNTGSLFRKDGELQKVNPFKQTTQAKELGINILGDKKLF